MLVFVKIFGYDFIGCFMVYGSFMIYLGSMNDIKVIYFFLEILWERLYVRVGMFGLKFIKR